MPEGSGQQHCGKLLRKGSGGRWSYQKTQGTQMSPVQPVFTTSLRISCLWSWEACSWLCLGLVVTSSGFWTDTCDSLRVPKLLPGALVGKWVEFSFLTTTGLNLASNQYTPCKHARHGWRYEPRDRTREFCPALLCAAELIHLSELQCLYLQKDNKRLQLEDPALGFPQDQVSSAAWGWKNMN